MKLNEQGRIKLRKLVEEQLVNVPEGQRIHLDKDLLEDLLFETVVYKKETGDFFKLPIWSGPFLRKIDLSEVSFEDVSWGLMNEFYLTHFGESLAFAYDDLNMDTDVLEKLEEDFEAKFSIDFSYTNANINLNSSFEVKKIGILYYGCCNFAGVDLSKSNICNSSFDNNLSSSERYRYGCSFEKCDFSYTNININNATYYRNNRIYFAECNFEGNNYSNIVLDSSCFNTYDYCYGCFLECNFKNTGINIRCFNKKTELDFYKLLDFAKLIDIGFFDGCCIDGRFVLPKTQRPDFDEEVLSQNFEYVKQYVYDSLGASKEEVYVDFEQKMYDSVVSDIEGQIKGFKR